MLVPTLSVFAGFAAQAVPIGNEQSRLYLSLEFPSLAAVVSLLIVWAGLALSQAGVSGLTRSGLARASETRLIRVTSILFSIVMFICAALGLSSR